MYHITIFSIVIAGFVGWIANLWQVTVGITSLDKVTDMSGMLAFKAATVFIPPVGAVMGWIGFF